MTKAFPRLRLTLAAVASVVLLAAGSAAALAVDYGSAIQSARPLSLCPPAC